MAAVGPQKKFSGADGEKKLDLVFSREVEYFHSNHKFSNCISNWMSTLDDKFFTHLSF